MKILWDYFFFLLLQYPFLGNSFKKLKYQNYEKEICL